MLAQLSRTLTTSMSLSLWVPIIIIIIIIIIILGASLTCLVSWVVCLVCQATVIEHAITLHQKVISPHTMLRLRPLRPECLLFKCMV